MNVSKPVWAPGLPGAESGCLESDRYAGSWKPAAAQLSRRVYLAH